MSYRVAFALAFAACAALLGYAYFLEYVRYLDPCPLCMVQRLVFYVLGAVFLVAALHAPGRIGRSIYAVLITLVSGLGIATAARHLWLQSLPADEIPDCGPGLEYMLETMPLSETLNNLVNASGSCATVDWTFLGLSMPAWTLIWYAGLAGWALLWSIRAPLRQRRLFH